jgi:hypothetical protein
MPYYEYQGKTYDIATDDPAEAKAKIQKYLGSSKIEEGTGEEFGAGELAQMIAPAATSSQIKMVPTTVPVAPQAGGMGPPSQTTPVKPQMVPTGAGQLVEDIRGAKVMQPLSQTLTSRFGDYVAKPAKAVIDAATMITTGIPGAAPAALYDTYKAATEAVPRMRQALGAIPDVDRRGVVELYDKLKPADQKAFQKLLDQGGKRAIEMFTLPDYLAKDAAAVANLDLLKTQAAAVPGMASRFAMPVLRTAARALGPVGLGMDVYDASQYAHESNLGPRLAQGQGRMAQQAFRNMATNQQYGGLTPSEQRVLEQDRIDQAIRRKAAEKVLGPVVPPGY